ncbi:hypothetical protein NF212_06600 [Parasalinivibrio latis]|uniref:hypothetical protein n=1 Tax=Parasalinivibrio latis TaxID=2952610 RepID=UPI0030E3E240
MTCLFTLASFEEIEILQDTCKAEFGCGMTRAEFFKTMHHTIGRWYSVYLAVSLGLLAFLRITDNEESIKLAILLFLTVVPGLLYMLVASQNRMYNLHRYVNRDVKPYKAPSIFSLRLIPYSMVVAMVSLVPPAIVTSIFFDLSSQVPKHTLLINISVEMNMLVLWFIWVVNPCIKKYVVKNATAKVDSILRVDSSNEIKKQEMGG